MLNKIYVATNNAGKLREIKALLPEFEVLGIKDLGYDFDVLEDGLTFAENSFKKANALYELTDTYVFADDSGLCVDALGGAPGIYSARFGGEHGDDEENIRKLLSELSDVPDEKRGAKFVCDICLIDCDGNVFHAVGECHGKILHAKRGENGFGYDPVFYVPSHDKTMAELSPDEKNKISHRAIALDILKKEFLKRGLIK